ncbi:UNVERIFIED_ORG: DNA-binding NarL/FixJ family response regulator [Variovorax paradoxus]|nr:DNA-binding NarL/FixJ family response regulator [Variovorax paradoxus]
MPSLRSLSSPSGILIVDDHDLVRLGVRALLQAQASPSGHEVEIFEADCLAQALAVYERFASSIGLVLMDLALPDTQGLSAISRFHERHPDARIVALSGTGTTSLAQSAMAQGALTLGASAFLPKSANLKEVVSFIRACGLLGSDVVDGLAGSAPASSARRVPRPSYSRAWRNLTASQVRVLQMVLEGKTNKEIAQLADLGEGTVRNYVSTILLLFGMKSRAQLISSLR